MSDLNQGVYTDGSTAPAHPNGVELVFNNNGTMTAVSAANPLPGTATISGSVTATNPSVGTDGSAIPTSSTLIGGSDGTNLQPLQVDGSKNLKTNLATALPAGTNVIGHVIVDSGSITEANSASIAANTTGLATQSTLSAVKTDLDTIVTQTATPNVSDRWARQVGQIDIARVLGATMSATNPIIDQDQIRAFIVNGQGFSATTGKQTSGGAIQTGMCLINPANSGKNVLIYSVRVGVASSSVHQLNLVTADPTLSGISVTAINSKPGGNSSVVTLEAQNTAVTTSGTMFDTQYLLANTSVEFLLNGSAILLPATSTINGVLVLPATSTNAWLAGMKWIEY